MKTFVYKSLFIFVLFFLFFQLTIGAKIKEFENKIDYIKSQESIQLFKNKIRKELTNANKKDKYLSDEDAKLINRFLKKIKIELENN
jgi:hypothetical protein|tara:strand:+ start:613 stop:873 length:261 start_codon:yes stop_codon:yes gene_type:complete